jgi:nucleoid DNA-binding protein
VSNNNISINIENGEEIIEALGVTKAQMKKAVKRTVSDLKQRVPGWISEKVMEEYNIKKKDIKEALKIKNRATTVEISGVKVDSLDFVFKGRPLTPIHFKMKPNKPYKHNRKYTVSAEIKKGNRVTLGTKGVFIQKPGNGGERYLPFQRQGDARYPIDVIRTVSIPQMITNDKVKEEIQQKVDREALERLRHNADRIFWEDLGVVR